MIATVRLTAALVLLIGERYLSDPSMILLLCATLVSSYAYIDLCRACHERKIAAAERQAGINAAMHAITRQATAELPDRSHRQTRDR